MTGSQPLAEWCAEIRRAIFEQLSAKRAPHIGEYDEKTFVEAMARASPQMGATRFDPNRVNFEFIFPETASNTLVLVVRVEAPERIVCMPVPDWVIDSIWQGEIDGSFHFESDARRLLAEFASQIEPEKNRELFGLRRPRGRQ
jgi:hypothetical protein